MDNKDPRALVIEVGRRVRKATKGLAEFTNPIIRKEGERGLYTYSFEMVVPRDLVPDHLKKLDAKSYNCVDNKNTKKSKKWAQMTSGALPKVTEALIKEFGEPTQKHPNGVYNWDLSGCEVVMCVSHPGVDILVWFDTEETVRE